MNTVGAVVELAIPGESRFLEHPHGRRIVKRRAGHEKWNARLPLQSAAHDKLHGPRADSPAKQIQLTDENINIHGLHRNVRQIRGVQFRARGMLPLDVACFSPVRRDDCVVFRR